MEDFEIEGLEELDIVKIYDDVLEDSSTSFLAFDRCMCEGNIWECCHTDYSYAKYGNNCNCYPSDPSYYTYYDGYCSNK